MEHVLPMQVKNQKQSPALSPGKMDGTATSNTVLLCMLRETLFFKPATNT